MQTIKLPYYTSSNSDKSTILSYLKQYSNCLHFMFNRTNDNLSETTIKHLPINNIQLLDSWFKQSCVKEATQIATTNKNTKVIFGGKKNFFNRLNNKITKDEYKILKLSPLYSIGEKSNPSVKANRKFHIEQDLLNITFKPNKLTKIPLKLPILKQNYLKILKTLYLRQEQKNISITYKIDTKYIYISFDEKELSVNPNRPYTENRVLSIDLNPNYIGWSIVDWLSESEFRVVKSGVYSLKYLNDIERELGLSSSDSRRKYISDKRRYEVLEICKNLVGKGLYYGVEMIGIEDLSIRGSDKGKGKMFNRLCNNNWLRNDMVNNIGKRCNIYGIRMQKVRAEYSSFVGNMVFRGLKLPDMVLSAIEIGRRAYEYLNQYIKKTKDKKKNIIIPNDKFYKDLVVKSLEEFDIKFEFSNLVELYYLVKKSKIRYRLSLEELGLKFLRQRHKKYEAIII